MRPVFHWNLGRRSLELGKRTLIMGIVNVTPDSFSDGGQFLDPQKAIVHAERLLEEGADIIDIGGESTRPGARVSAGDDEQRRDAPVVSAEEERQRVIPVITQLKSRNPDAVISIDTYKASVACAAVESGAEIVNDVSGLRWDAQMPKTLAELHCGVVLMHMRGRPDQWRSLPPPDDVVHLITRELRGWSDVTMLAGIARDRIVLDPGFGFGKKFEENYPLFAGFDQLAALGFPLLAGTSRKSFIGRMLAQNGKDAPVEARLYGSIASEVALILKGAHIIRTHAVKPSVEAARAADKILQAQPR
jgi:dihydropteroate synthase